jgi:hypothetical protein
MLKLGNGINGVILKFGPKSDAPISSILLSFMKDLLATDIQDFMDASKTYKLISLHISSTSEPYHAHKIGGPHRSGLAVDIAEINGKSITRLYNHDEELTGICDALQVKATDDKRVFENYGPLICFKTDRAGNINQIKKDTTLISMHKSHLHFSVRG